VRQPGTGRPGLRRPPDRILAARRRVGGADLVWELAEKDLRSRMADWDGEPGRLDTPSSPNFGVASRYRGKIKLSGRLSGKRRPRGLVRCI
jgi:hypothetical protein